MGGGFTMSKKRNTMNAHNCPVNVAGVTNSNTSQNAMISSHTTGDGSEMPIFFAVKPQNQQPATKPTAISTAHSATVRCGLNTTNDAHANKVPTVPGAMGDKPLPKPSDKICSGCDSMKRALVRRDGFGRGVSSIVSMIGSVCMKMVEACVWQRNRTGFVAPANERRVLGCAAGRSSFGGQTLDCTDTRQQNFLRLSDPLDVGPHGDRRGEAEFVVIAARHDAIYLRGFGQRDERAGARYLIDVHRRPHLRALQDMEQVAGETVGDIEGRMRDSPQRDAERHARFRLFERLD